MAGVRTVVDPDVKGLILDWGGVLTAPLESVIPQWARSEQVDPSHLRDVLRSWLQQEERTGKTSPSHRLERGEASPEEFEKLLVAELARRGSTVRPEGLLKRMLAGLAELDAVMIDLVRTAREAGIRTALLSNSWGECYPDALWDGLFDAVVISGRVGMRKPEPAIFRHTLAELDLPAAQCVMVDDMSRNVEAAAALGLLVIHHVDRADTVTRLGEMVGGLLEAGSSGKMCAGERRDG